MRFDTSGLTIMWQSGHKLLVLRQSCRASDDDAAAALASMGQGACHADPQVLPLCGDDHTPPLSIEYVDLQHMIGVTWRRNEGGANTNTRDTGDRLLVVC